MDSNRTTIMRNDSPTSLFNPLSESTAEETGPMDTTCNPQGLLAINISGRPQPCVELSIGQCLEKPTVIPDRIQRYDFFDCNLKTERRTFLKTLGLNTLTTALVLLAALSIFWGTLWKLDEHAYKLRGIVMDFDGGAVGQAVLRASQERTGSPRQIAWTVGDSLTFKDISAVSQAVLDEQYWVALVVQPGSTNRIQKAISSADANYNGTRAVTVIVAQARQEQAYSHFLFPQSVDILRSAQQLFRATYTQSLSQISDRNLMNVMRNAPQTILNPFDFEVNDLRPFDVSQTTALTAIGLIYVAMAALVTCTQSAATRNQLGLNEKLTLRSLIQVRICSPFISYFWLSLSYALLNVFFHVPFSRFLGHGGFLLCWLMFFLGMSALGLTIEAVTVHLTPQCTSYFMIFWIICNISVCSLPIDVLPSFYKYAYITPFYNVNRAARYIILNGKNDLLLNFGVQLTWTTVSVVKIALHEIWKRRKLQNLRNQNIIYT